MIQDHEKNLLFPAGASYSNGLTGIVLKRYQEKNKICGKDPFKLTVAEVKKNFQLLPRVTDFDIVYYLVEAVSYYTMEQFRAYKSLSAYKNFNDGWLQDIFLNEVSSTRVLVLAKVKHSFRFSISPAQCGILCEKEGEILVAHCDCMAGLGECCSHVATALFGIKYLVNNGESRTVTDIKAKWPMPSLKNIPLAQIKNMDLSSANRQPDANQNHSGRMLFPSQPTVLDVPLSELEITNLIRKCIDGGSVPVIATITAPFSDMFHVPETDVLISNEPESQEPEINQFEISQMYFSSFFKTEYEQKSIEELNNIAESIDFSRSLDDLSLIERVTRTNRDQWRWFRIGKITGTSFKNCVRTN